MLLMRACGAEMFVPWTLLERAGVQRQTVLAMLRIIHYKKTSRILREKIVGISSEYRYSDAIRPINTSFK
uniref:Uncharacterized protein n=1 Tax=Brassica oleracea TaxID=3712 RepID=A0A3P6FAN1_BRAOL|nr:unnamed protein product [Brassica oleracea]